MLFKKDNFAFDHRDVISNEKHIVITTPKGV